MAVKKVAVIGPESTGKSTLSAALARHFQTQWVPEYAREYLQNLGRPYREPDLLEIARRQIKMEDDLLPRASGYLFCDTTLVVIKVWSEHSYGRCHPWIARQVEERHYDYFLLTDIDMPWEPDPLREHPDKRDYFFKIYRTYLENNDLPFTRVSGDVETRLQKAAQVVEKL